MKTLYTVIGTLAILIIAFFAYIFSGYYDPSSLTKHNGLTVWAIKTTLNHSIKKRAGDIQVPSNLKDSSAIHTGFEHYNEMCVGCHGAPGIEPSEAAKGLYPAPPLIYKFADQMSPKTAFWIIKYGVKMTGMPAFKPTHPDDKIWDMTAFITQKLGKMTPAEYKAWQRKYHGSDEGDK